MLDSHGNMPRQLGRAWRPGTRPSTSVNCPLGSSRASSIDIDISSTTAQIPFGNVVEFSFHCFFVRFRFYTKCNKKVQHKCSYLHSYTISPRLAHLSLIIRARLDPIVPSSHMVSSYRLLLHNPEVSHMEVAGITICILPSSVVLWHQQLPALTHNETTTGRKCCNCKHYKTNFKIICVTSRMTATGWYPTSIC